MAQYLKGSSVETDVTRQRARLQGINNETYVYHCNELGNPHYPQCQTMYEYELISHPITFEDALKIEETTYLPSIHLSRLVSNEQMELDGWFEVIEQGG